jgi:RNA polymerase sigma-70 factor (ECF subfamily)
VSLFEGNRALLDAFRRGDRDALSEVYARYVDEVDTLVRRGFVSEANGHLYVPGVRDVELERDLVQEVFVRAFSESARLAFDGLRPYRPYLLRIAKNLLVDQLRKRKHAPVESSGPDAVDIDDLIEKNAPVAEPPEDELHWRSLTLVARSFLSTLDEEARRVVALRFEEQLSQDEVAQRMKITRRRVRTLEERVQAGLRRCLRERGHLVEYKLA